MIIYRYRSNLNLNENSLNTKLFDQKQKIQSLTEKFIKMVKYLKRPSQTIEQGISSLFFESDNTKIIRFSEIAEDLFILIHSFSEENVCNYPRFVKFITLLVQNLFLVKRCLNAQFSEFYEELETNYKNLERELETLLENQSAKTIKPKTKLVERLTL